MDSPQGGVTGAGGVVGHNYFPDGGTEAAFVATFVLFITWLLSLFATPIVHLNTSDTDHGREREASGPLGRISYLTRVARDGFLLLFATTVANFSGHGISSAVEILSWIVMGLVLLWELTIVGGVAHWWVELLFVIPVVIIEAISFGLAFRNAPSQR
ncbi:hypothetical protein DFJ73DRAFT_773064 [Zopfochytrium polystomum]|nr:hypothetical protein DFJ73DRAFT_773064 [Zopfochytrium polystomum]